MRYARWPYRIDFASYHIYWLKAQASHGNDRRVFGFVQPSILQNQRVNRVCHGEPNGLLKGVKKNM